jgi:nicotinic acid phosphoribosyltransferase
MDLKAWIHSLRPAPPSAEDLAWVAESNGLHLGQGYRHALQQGEIQVDCLPQGTWFRDQEPLAVVTGPSALVSTMEATVIGETAFRLQVATLAMRHQMGLLSAADLRARLGRVTCAQEAEIIGQTLDQVGVARFQISVEAEAFQAHVRTRCSGILELLNGDASRIAEGGLRSATCPENHLLAVHAAQESGWKATSNVWLAKELGMKAVGTTGHEHTQRHGSDLNAFEAATDRVPGNVTLLLDTYNTRHSGIPRAIQVMKRWAPRLLSARPDCEPTQEGDVHMMLASLKEAGLDGGISLSGGFDAERTARFEDIRRFHEWPAARFSYLYGGFAVKSQLPLPTRSTVSAVFKVCQSAGRATMKFSDGADGRPGPKSSKPGHPVVFRLQDPLDPGPMGWIGQDGEAPPQGYVRLNAEHPAPALSAAHLSKMDGPSGNSPATTALVARCTAERQAAMTPDLGEH